MNITIELFGKKYRLFATKKRRVIDATPKKRGGRKLRKVSDSTYDSPELLYMAMTTRMKKKLAYMVAKKPSYGIHSGGHGSYRFGMQNNGREFKSRSFNNIEGAQEFRDRLIQLYRGTK